MVVPRVFRGQPRASKVEAIYYDLAFKLQLPLAVRGDASFGIWGWSGRMASRGWFTRSPRWCCLRTGWHRQIGSCIFSFVFLPVLLVGFTLGIFCRGRWFLGTRGNVRCICSLLLRNLMFFNHSSNLIKSSLGNWPHLWSSIFSQRSTKYFGKNSCLEAILIASSIM